MSDGRYIKIQALQVEDNKLVPFWELEFDDTGDYGVYKTKDSWRTYSTSNLIECVYDMKKKRIKPFSVVDHKDLKTLEYKVGERVYREVSSRTYTEDVIKDITFAEFTSQFYPARKIPDYYKHLLSEEQLNSNEFFEIRLWEPHYLMESGATIEYHMYLKHIYSADFNKKDVDSE